MIDLLAYSRNCKRSAIAPKGSLRHFDEAIGAIERLVANNVQAERRMTPKSERSLSAAARRKIARAQKARWAKLRQGKAARS